MTAARGISWAAYLALCVPTGYVAYWSYDVRQFYGTGFVVALAVVGGLVFFALGRGRNVGTVDD